MAGQYRIKACFRLYIIWFYFVQRVQSSSAIDRQKSGELYKIYKTPINTTWLSVALHWEDFMVLFTPPGALAWQQSGELNNNKETGFYREQCFSIQRITPFLWFLLLITVLFTLLNWHVAAMHTLPFIYIYASLADWVFVCVRDYTAVINSAA